MLPKTEIKSHPQEGKQFEPNLITHSQENKAPKSPMHLTSANKNEMANVHTKHELKTTSKTSETRNKY